MSVRVAEGDDCAAHSYGKVESFFQTSPCDLLSRAVLELADKHKNVVLVAISRVDMPTGNDARRFKILVDKSGTGNVTELSREVGPYKSVRFTGKFYTSSIDGLTVRNTQVQPAKLLGSTEVLKAIERELKN